MKGLTKKQMALVLLINSIIAFAYYFDNLEAYYSELSSDIQNIIPVAQKFDNPTLFQKDLYLNNLDNVKYYTPFYVQSLRFIAQCVGYDYVQAINVLGLLCHLLFGVLWFFVLFKYVSNFWVSLLVSILVRGIVWLPGLEIWGISDLWSIMPRTVYITLLPLPFIILSYKLKTVFFASFLIGLIFNFHPITGLGGILLFLSLLILIGIYFNEKSIFTIKTSLMILVSIFLGMLPFIVTYFGKTSSVLNYNPDVFDALFKLRIPDYFSNPIAFLKQWLSFKTLFYFIPLLGYFIFALKHKDHLKRSKLLLVLTSILIVLPVLSIPLEQFINTTFNLNLRLSFQLIRVQKVAIIPGLFALAFLLKYFFEANTYLVKSQPYVFACYIVLLMFSHTSHLKSMPFLGDDISTKILPQNLTYNSSIKNTELAVDRMAKFISEHTLETDLLCASHIYRGATRRSVVFDGKGSSMLIEGNPEQFITWQKRQQKINNLNSLEAVVSYLKSFDVDYYVTRIKNIPAELVHQEGSILLYKL